MYRSGLMLKNNRYFTQYLPKGFTLGKWKLVHGLSGFVCYSAACGVIMLGACAACTEPTLRAHTGIYSSWYQGAVHEYVWCATGVGVLLLLGLALNHATELLKAQKAALQQRAKSVAAASKAGKK
jgi:heme exporter protein D